MGVWLGGSLLSQPLDVAVCGFGNRAFGGRLKRLGIFYTGRGRFGYAAWFGVMQFWLGYRVNISCRIGCICPRSTVPFALGLNVVASGSGNFVNYGAGDVC